MSQEVPKEVRAALEDLFDDYNMARWGSPSRLTPEQVADITAALSRFYQEAWRKHRLVAFLYLHEAPEDDQARFPQWPRCTLKELAAFFGVSVDTIYDWRDRSVLWLAADLRALLPPGLEVPERLPLERPRREWRAPPRKLRDAGVNSRRAYCERRLRAYPLDMAKFRGLTRGRGREWFFRDHTPEDLLLPLGTVEDRLSRAGDGGQPMMSEDEVRFRAGDQPSEVVAWYQDRLLGMLALWGRLSDAERFFVNMRWFNWRPVPAPRLLDAFTRYQQRHPGSGPGPQSVREVWRWRVAILRLAEQVWLGGGTIPDDPPFE